MVLVRIRIHVLVLVGPFVPVGRIIVPRSKLYPLEWFLAFRERYELDARCFRVPTGFSYP